MFPIRLDGGHLEPPSPSNPSVSFPVARREIEYAAAARVGAGQAHRIGYR